MNLDVYQRDIFWLELRKVPTGDERVHHGQCTRDFRVIHKDERTDIDVRFYLDLVLLHQGLLLLQHDTTNAMTSRSERLYSRTNVHGCHIVETCAYGWCNDVVQ